MQYPTKIIRFVVVILRKAYENMVPVFLNETKMYIFESEKHTKYTLRKINLLFVWFYVYNM